MPRTPMLNTDFTVTWLQIWKIMELFRKLFFLNLGHRLQIFNLKYKWLQYGLYTVPDII